MEADTGPWLMPLQYEPGRRQRPKSSLRSAFLYISCKGVKSQRDKA